MPDDASARLTELVEALADGTPVDWSAAESGATSDDERAAVRRLSRIGQAASWHRQSPSTTRAMPSWSHLQLREKIGEGAFGTVYRARDPRLARDVALKLLHEPMSATGARASAVIEEGRLLARVRHPNVVTVYGAECLNGQVGIWTEFIEGETLHAIVAERGRMNADEATAIGLDLCRALFAVHEAGLLHRDIKAQNVMRDAGGRIVLMDFGTGRDTEPLTARKNDVSGTPLYLAPEVFAGGPASVASDVYALGVLLFFLLTGQFPVSGRTLKDVQAAHRERRARRLADVRPDIPQFLSDAIERGLATDPAARHATALAFAAALSPHEEVRTDDAGAAPLRRRTRAIITAVVVVSGFAVPGWIAMTHSNPRPAGIVDAQRWTKLGFRSLAMTAPDGRYLSTAAPDGNLALHDLETGTERRLTNAPPNRTHADESALSRDGTQVAYAWYNDAGKVELRAVTFDADSASAPRTLIKDPEAEWIVPHDWSPDGAWIAATMARRDGTLHMGLVSVKESRWTDLKSVVGGGPAKIVFAPDGQSLTYDLPVGDTPQHDVLLMDLSTHRETPLVVDRANDEVVGWTRAGTSLLFTSDRSGAIGLWDLPFADGAPGQARLIKSDLGSRTFTIGLTAAGALVYGKQTSTLNVYLAEVDFTTGHMVSPPVEVVEPYLFTNTGPDWSADGNQLVFASDRPKNVSAISVASAGGADPSRWLRPGAVQLVRWIRPDMEMFERPRWAPDGSITVQGTNRAGRGGFFRIDPRSGAAEPIVLAEPRTHVQQASWTSDGTRLVFRRYGADESWAIVARNIREMREVELVSRERGTALAGLSLSPDDKDLAYIEHDKTSSTLCVLPLSGGKARTLFRVNKPAFLPNVTEWTPEGSRLIYSTSGANSTLSFWSVPAQGGTSVKLEGFTPRLGTNTLRIHRDGRTVAFTMGNSKHEVWTLENFLPNAR